MNNMNRKANHPDIELLDQLRAGLLDDQDALKQELETHLQTCKQCSQQTDWGYISKQLVDSKTVSAKLSSIAKFAVNAPQRTKRYYLPVAAAASVMVVLMATFMLNDINPVSQPVPIANQAQVESIDLYENLDFYQWLADHNGQSINPNQSNDQQS